MSTAERKLHYCQMPTKYVGYDKTHFSSDDRNHKIALPLAQNNGYHPDNRASAVKYATYKYDLHALALVNFSPNRRNFLCITLNIFPSPTTLGGERNKEER